MPKNVSTHRPSFVAVLVALVLTVGILYLGKPFLVPLALAILITFVLSPIVRVLQHFGLRRVTAVLGVVVIAFGIMAAIGWGVWSQVQLLASELPAHQAEIERKVASLRLSNNGAIGKLMSMVDRINTAKPPAEENPSPLSDKPRVIVTETAKPSAFEQLSAVVAPVIKPLATAGLVIVLVVFMLIRREDLRNRILGLLGHGHLTRTTRVLMDAAERVSSYLLNQLLVNAGFGIVFGLGLILLGVPYAFLWAALAAVLRFIPFVGSWMALALPLALSIAIAPGWTQPVLVFAFFAVLELVTGNVLEPLLFGHTTGLSPVALLIAAAFWIWIWGPIGLVLSTPLTVCLVVLGQHIPRFRFLSLLLGDQPGLAPHASYYQRLVARDKAEAAKLTRAYTEEQGRDKVYDDVLLPALLLARRDRNHGGLQAAEEEFLYQATQEIVAERCGLKAPAAKEAQGARSGDLREAGREPAVPESPAEEPDHRELILGCPAHHEAEELSLQMLAHLLADSGYRMEVLSSKALPAEIEARVEQEDPREVFIGVLPPGGLLQARYLCRRLHKAFPNLPIVVGFWGATPRNFDRILVRLRAAGAGYVTTSLLQSRSQLLALARQHSPA
jgi:predicted PurR-regulated permease PerM